MRHILALQGLPASGKTTFAKALLELNDKAIRVNNDDICLMMFGAAWKKPTKESTALLRKARHAIVKSAFESGYELVIIDNTNLTENAKGDLLTLALECGAELEYESSFLSVPIEECLRRNSERENPVPEKVIHTMAQFITE